MFFILSKLFWLVAEPINFLLLLGVLGAVLRLFRFGRLGCGLMATSVVLIGTTAFSPIGALALRPLEDRFPLPSEPLPAPAGIIVLGGAMDADLTQARGAPTLLAAASRLTEGVALARRFPSARLVITGGSASLGGHDAPEAPATRDLWLSLGVAADRLVVEAKARDTWENARFTQGLLQPRPGQTWLLVTSAWHMPRAMGVFRKVGFDVVAYPVDYRSFGDRRDLRPTLRALDALMTFDDAVHEWVGLVAYHLRGKTDAWFPAP